MPNIPAIELLAEFKQCIDPVGRKTGLLAYVPIVAASLAAGSIALVVPPGIGAAILFIACMLAGFFVLAPARIGPGGNYFPATCSQPPLHGRGLYQVT